MRHREMAKSEHGVDEALDSGAQKQIAQILKAMPDQEPNLQWTASLNERLYVVQEKTRRRARWNRVLQPVAGFSLVGALAMAVLVNLQPSPKPGPKAIGIEARLVSTHRESLGVTDLTGAGLSSHEVDQKTVAMPAGYDWNEVDLGAL
ncbi:MAG TPA: hypothetical protein VEX38_09630 [Fimbriimonadaceae bacterium]|nr:hypothetical protein [Fimbriimonadaceae bacterium]